MDLPTLEILEIHNIEVYYTFDCDYQLLLRFFRLLCVICTIPMCLKHEFKFPLPLNKKERYLQWELRSL